MQSFVGALRRSAGANITGSNVARAFSVSSHRSLGCIPRLNSPVGSESLGLLRGLSRRLSYMPAEVNSSSSLFPQASLSRSGFDAKCASPFPSFSSRSVTTSVNPVETPTQEPPASDLPISPRIKFKRLDKTARHIMQILDKEAVTSVKEQREIPDVKPGYIIQMKVESPENKRRISTIKGVVIARRNAGLNTTFRLRRLVAGVGVESLFPLYSPNIKEVKVLEKKKVRRAKLYYLREKMNALRR